MHGTIAALVVKESLMVPWHRLFGLALTDLFHDTSFRVELEKDLSLRQQFLDVAVIAVEALEEAFVAPDSPPDGLDDLGRHNLLTFKSLREPLDAWALDEFLGHFVNYRKQCSSPGEPLAPLEDFRLIAVTARFPEGLASQAALTERCRGVYNVRWGVREIRVVVLNAVSHDPRNALWELFSGVPARVVAGWRHYRWRRPDLSTVLQKLVENYHEEGVEVPYTVEDYHREILGEMIQKTPPEVVLSYFTPEQRLKGLPSEERLKGLPSEERLKGLPPDERLKGLPSEEILRRFSIEEILAYLKKQGK